MRIHALKLKTFLSKDNLVDAQGLVTDPFDPSKKVRVRDAQVLGHKPIVEREDGSPVDEKKYAVKLIGTGRAEEIALSEVAAWEERLQDAQQTEKISPHHLALPNVKLFEEFYESGKGEELNPHRREHTRAALRYNRKYAFIEVGSDPMIYDRATGKRYTTEKHKKVCAGDHFFVNSEDGDGKKSGKRVSAWEAWFGHPARSSYRETIFAPCGKDTSGRDVDLNYMLNTWRGFAIKPKKGDWRLFEDFLRTVVCNGDEQNFRYLIGWMAHLFQRPWEKPGVAVAMIGGQGTGKGTTGDFLLEAVGAAMSVYTSKDKHLAGDFSVSDEPPLLHFHDESTSGDKKVAAAKKAQISETREQVERKGKDNRSAMSSTRYMLATNDADGFDVHSDDRRHFVLNLSDGWKQDTKRFRELRRLMIHEDGLAAMVFDLMYRVRLSRDQDIDDCVLDLTVNGEDFDVRTPPMTKAKQDMVEVRLPPGAQAVLDMIKERRLYAIRGGAGVEVNAPLNYDASTWIDKDTVEAALAEKFGKGTTKTALFKKLKEWGVVDTERGPNKSRGVLKPGYRFRPIKESGPDFVKHHKLSSSVLESVAEATISERLADTARALVRQLDEMRGGTAWIEEEHAPLARVALECLRQANELCGHMDQKVPDLDVGPTVEEGVRTLH